MTSSKPSPTWESVRAFHQTSDAPHLLSVRQSPEGTRSLRQRGHRLVGDNARGGEYGQRVERKGLASVMGVVALAGCAAVPTASAATTQTVAVEIHLFDRPFQTSGNPPHLTITRRAKPVAGAQIALAASEHVVGRATTNTIGEADFRLTPGTYNVVIQSRGATYRRQIRVYVGRAREGFLLFLAR